MRTIITYLTYKSYLTILTTLTILTSHYRIVNVDVYSAVIVNIDNAVNIDHLRPLNYNVVGFNTPLN